MTPTQPYATFTMQGSGRGLLRRLETNPRIGTVAFGIICMGAVLALSTIVLGIGMAGCVASFALMVAYGKTAAIAMLLLDAVVVALLGVIGAVVLFD